MSLDLLFLLAVVGYAIGQHHVSAGRDQLERAFAEAQTLTLISDDPDLRDVSSITTDGIHLYVGGSSGGVARIWRIPIGGGPATRLYAAPWTSTGGCCTVGLAVIGDDLFWIDPNSGPITDTQILRAPKSGAGPVTAIYTGSFVGEPIVDGTGLTTDGIALFTADEVQGRVHRLSPDGSGLTFLGSRYGGFFDTEHLNTIDNSGLDLFIADSGRADVGIPPQVVSLPKAGGPFTPLHVGPPFVCPGGITAGNGVVFVADACANTIWSLPLTGGVPTVVVSGPPFVQITGVTFFDTALYVTDSGNGGSINGPGKAYKVMLVPASQGMITSLIASPPIVELFQRETFAVGGTGTCGSLTLNFGDGNSTTLSGAFPLRTTHVYVRGASIDEPGFFVATATGTVSCNGSASTSVREVVPPIIITTITTTTTTTTTSTIVPCPGGGAGPCPPDPPTPHTLIIINEPSGLPNPVGSGGTATLGVTAVDSQGHPLTYTWTADCPAPLVGDGSFNDPTLQTPTWTAPQNTTGSQQSCTIQVVISDGQGQTQTPAFSQGVSPEGGGPSEPTVPQLLNVSTLSGPGGAEQQTFLTIDPILAEVTYFDPNAACAGVAPVLLQLLFFNLEGQLLFTCVPGTPNCTITSLPIAPGSKYQALSVNMAPGALAVGAYNLVFLAKDCTSVNIFVSGFYPIRVLTP